MNIIIIKNIFTFIEYIHKEYIPKKTKLQLFAFYKLNHF